MFRSFVRGDDKNTLVVLKVDAHSSMYNISIEETATPIIDEIDENEK